MLPTSVLHAEMPSAESIQNLVVDLELVDL